ncbi:diguanylate cyclase [Desulfovibrionales bacterium]
MHILIVDDRPENLLTLEHLLDMDGLTVVRACSGQEALSKLFDYDFALILMDVQMPDMDGFETAELMRGHARTRHIPIIFVTANHTERQHIFRGYDAGAVDYMFKPLDPQMLLSKVHVFLEIYRQRVALQEKTRELDQKILQLQALQAELEEKNRQLHILSSLDGLTGIPNRRQFDATLRQEWTRLTREQLPLALIILDVDHFKRYNDTYGHVVGDSCLKQVAQALAALLKRPADLVARYGGEEFAAILPGTNQEGAEHMAETMRQAIINLNIEHTASLVLPLISMSLGVSAVIPGPGCMPGDLIQAADKALYEAKLGGRNRWVSHACIPDACIPALN